METPPAERGDAPPAITLREITIEIVGDVCELAVAPEQSSFVAANAFSLAQAYCIPEAWPRAIYAGETPVGFMMLHDDPVAQEYYLWRFMIDARYQGRGYGRAAIQQLLDYVRTRPGATCLTVAVVPKAGGPGPFYERLGFRYTGEEKHGELRMERPL